MKKSDLYESKTIVKADPHAYAASPDHVNVMISGGNRNSLSANTDFMPPVYRQGAMDANELPSRMGNRLHYRDGRVETIDPT